MAGHFIVFEVLSLAGEMSAAHGPRDYDHLFKLLIIGDSGEPPLHHFTFIGKSPSQRGRVIEKVLFAEGLRGRRFNSDTIVNLAFFFIGSMKLVNQMKEM